MPLTASARRSRQSVGARRAGYLVGIIVGAVLLLVLNVWPGWQALPVLTSATTQVLWLVNFSLAAGVAVNLIYLAHDPPWLRSLGDLATAAIGLAAAIRIWQVFPFDFQGYWAGWSLVVRALLVVTIVAACIGIIAHVASLASRVGRHAARGSHPSAGR
jgi:hypothetical protein